MGEFLDTKMTVSVKTGVVIIGFIFSLVTAATWGYVRLDQKADIGVKNRDTLEAMQCDVRQLKNFMLYGIKPAPVDRCDK